MTDSDLLIARVRAAWSQIPAPPAIDLKYMAWASGEDAWRTFLGVAPVDVDISSPGFLGCTPLRDLPPAAAAAYLGSYLLSMLDGLKFQQENVVFYDSLTRAHLIDCLSDPNFWQDVIRPHLPAECQQSLVKVCDYLSSQKELLALPPEQLDRIVALARSLS